MTTVIANNIDEVEARAYSIETAAQLLAVSAGTIRNWVAAKKIESCKFGRRRVIPASEITRIINEARAASAQ